MINLPKRLISAIRKVAGEKKSLFLHEPSLGVEEAKNYVTQAIKNEPGLGKGHGPLNHFFMLS